MPQQLFTATDAIGFSYGVTWNMVRRNIFAWKREDFEPQRTQRTQRGEDGRVLESKSFALSAFSAVEKEVQGRLEEKVKSFCAIPRVLAFLKDYILFAEKDEELNKYILRQHQTDGVEKVVGRALDPVRTRGLVWNTQGSGKTFTMIKTAQMLFRAPDADKPTVLLMIDRNELENQMLKNLERAVNLKNSLKGKKRRRIDFPDLDLIFRHFSRRANFQP